MCDVHKVPGRNDQEKLTHAAKEALDAINSTIISLSLTIISDALAEVSANRESDVIRLAEQLRNARDEIKNENINNALAILSGVRDSSAQ